MDNIDLKLLAIVSELHRTRSVSITAERLEISQSAVSMSLAKLRRHFHDPLFVRTSTGMEPTPYATELIGLLKRAEDILHSALGYHVEFDPATTDRSFVICSTDIAQVTMMPKLMSRLGRIAPGVRIDLRRISPTTPRELEAGDADVAVGYIRPMGAGFCQQRLFEERLVCVARRERITRGNVISMKDFENAKHLAISTSGTEHANLERNLEAEGVRRRIVLTVPSFLGVASLIATMDYLVLLPEQLARHVASEANLKVLRLPFDLPSYYIVQHWHERYTQDPASMWLRSVIAELFSSAGSVAARMLRTMPHHDNKASPAVVS